MISLTVQEWSYLVDRQTKNIQTNRQTVTAENNTTLAVRVVITLKTSTNVLLDPEGCAQQLTSACCHTAGEADFSWERHVNVTPAACANNAAVAAACRSGPPQLQRCLKLHRRPVSHLHVSPMKNPPHRLCGSTHYSQLLRTSFPDPIGHSYLFIG